MSWWDVFLHPRRSARNLERLEEDLAALSERLGRASELVGEETSRRKAAESAVREYEDRIKNLSSELAEANDALREQEEVEAELSRIVDVLEKAERIRERHEKQIATLRIRLHEEMERNQNPSVRVAARGPIDMTEDNDLSSEEEKEVRDEKVAKEGRAQRAEGNTAPDAGPHSEEREYTRQLQLFESAENEEGDEPLDLLSPLPEDFLQA